MKGAHQPSALALGWMLHFLAVLSENVFGSVEPVSRFARLLNRGTSHGIVLAPAGASQLLSFPPAGASALERLSAGAKGVKEEVKRELKVGGCWASSGACSIYFCWLTLLVLYGALYCAASKEVMRKLKVRTFRWQSGVCVGLACVRDRAL